MIRPEQILQKAQNLYDDFLAAWLAGDAAFFPRAIACRKTPAGRDLNEAIQAVRLLRENSCEKLGYGYTVAWREVNSRRFGRNQFPRRISFETQHDYLRFIGKQRQFEVFARAVRQLRQEFPELEGWIRTRPRALLHAAPELDGLIEVLKFFRARPRPGLFARELPLPVDTKFVERHQALLRQWFDLVLPPSSIRADEEHFERRYGLRYREPHVCLRLLDPRLPAELHFPCDEFSLPLPALAQLPVRGTTILIVENRVNLLTLPPLARSLGLGGLGHGVTVLRDIAWLAENPLVYWGDLDVEGFEILASLRVIFPHLRSLMMDRATLERHASLATEGNGRKPSAPLLAPEEQAAFEICRERNLRLEQERLPQAYVISALCGAQQLPRPSNPAADDD